jgi:hypothetical protein
MSKEKLITQFKGKTFSSNEQVIRWLEKAIDQTREETIREVDKYINDLEKYAKDNWEDQDTVNEAYFAIAQLNKLKK